MSSEPEMNPMSYFVNGEGADNPRIPAFKKLSLAEKVDRLVHEIVGMQALKDIIQDEFKTCLWNEKRRKFGIEVRAATPLVVISGAGDKEAALAHFASFYKIIGRVDRDVTHDLDLETAVGYWADTTRHNFEAADDEAFNKILVIRHLDKLMGSNLEGGDYGRYYLMRFIAKRLQAGRPVVVMASSETIQSWQSVCPDVLKIYRRSVNIRKYSADDLTWQFFTYADRDGYIYTHSLRTRMRTVFDAVKGRAFQAVDTNDLAHRVYSTCQDRQMRRLDTLPAEAQTKEAMTKFNQSDVVKLIIPYGHDVMIV